MFQSARLKLTAWYLITIMVVSFLFSTLIYRMLMNEVQRFEHAQRMRIERGLDYDMIVQSPDGRRMIRVPIPEGVELIEESKQRIFSTLLFINGGILIVAGGLGYFLAGRTLKPIKQMVEEQNRFVSDASHELRTPLTSLRAAFEVYLRDKKSTHAEANELIKESLEDVDKLQSLSESLLQLTQYEQNNGTAHFEAVKLDSIVEQAVKKTKHLAKKKSIKVAVTTVQATVWGNEENLTELFVILLDNAIKYSNAKSSVSVKMDVKDKTATVTVQDHGRGIAKPDLPHIFDRFYRTDAARSTQNHNGYGLGLSIAQNIAARHTGELTATSEVSKGSIFTVRIPLYHA